MSLRLRLLLSLLALSAVGLVIVDVVSYSSLKSHLSQRVDQQAIAARGPATIALIGRPFERRVQSQVAGGGPVRIGPGPGAGPEPGPGPPPAIAGGPGPPPGGQLPPGTYAEERNAQGERVHHILFSYGESHLATPAIPSQIPAAALAGEKTFTVGARAGGSTQFRVSAEREGNGSLTLVAVPLGDYLDTLHHVAVIGGIVTVSVLIGLGLLAWWLVRLGLRPLEEIEETAGRIAAGDLSQRVEETNPRTEVGRLGTSLNAMLGQIEGAFAQREASEKRMRRFLADASHELRTPLTSIRGYAEVFGMGAAEKPEDVEVAMRRIEQESARMSVMVNDLLSLARLDEVRAPLRERVELRRLVSEACADARAADPGRQISLSGPDSLEILGDPHQLRQVVTNLLTNAAVHTPAGTPVEVTLARADGQALLTVRDHGPGISEGAQNQIFERFWRQSPARGRESGGAGLGLAIVAAVVAAHGGRASAGNHPDGGAVFTVELPLGVEAAPIAAE